MAFSYPFLPQAMPSWTPPPLGNFKLNLDGSALGKQGQSSIGGVFRDSVKVKLLSFWRPSGF